MNYEDERGIHKEHRLSYTVPCSPSNQLGLSVRLAHEGCWLFPDPSETIQLGDYHTVQGENPHDA